MLFEQSRTITAGIIKLSPGEFSMLARERVGKECGRSREGWLDMERLCWRFRHLQGVENIPTWVQRHARPRMAIARNSKGCNGFEGSWRARGGQTGRHVSLRVIKVGPRYGGSCTTPVATKAPHHEPSLSPVTLSLYTYPLPLFTIPVSTNTPSQKF